MEIIVQGKGTEFFTPNEIIISINFYKKESTYEDALNSGVNNVHNFVNDILITNGFNKEDMKTRSFVVKEEQKYDNITKEYLPDGFSYSQHASIKFDYDKEKLANIMEQLSKMNDAPRCHITFGFKNEKECRRRILSNAYNDAEQQAKAIAEAAGKELKQCAKIDFKPFTTNYFSQTNIEGNMKLESGERMGSAGNIINTFTPEDIEISETLYCLWLTE